MADEETGEDDPAAEPETEPDGDGRDDPPASPGAGEPWVVPWRGTERLWRRPSRLWGNAPLPLRVAISVVAVVGGLWWILGPGAATGEDGPGPAQVVGGFFLAQEAGDCDRLVDLLAEESWSDDGKRSREEFLAECGAALRDGYKSAVGVVSIDVPSDREVGEGADPDVLEVGAGDRKGEVIREDGRWKVRIDEELLRIGPSVEETLHDYIDAYNARDCERQISLLSEVAWSADGELSREEFLDLCGPGTETGDGPTLDVPPLVIFESIHDLRVAYDDETETATMEAEARLLRGGSPQSLLDEPETIRFVREGIAWKVDGSEDLSGRPIGRDLLRATRAAELQARLVQPGHVEGPPVGDCFHYEDSHFEPDLDDIESGIAVRRQFSCNYDYVRLYRFADSEEAAAAAEQMAEEILNRDVPTVAEVEERGIIEDAEDYVARRRPSREIDVPDMPEAIGVEASCSVDGCRKVVLFLTRDDTVLQVDLDAADDGLAAATELLQAQLELV